MPLNLNARLIEAVETGPEANIKRLIETGASPNARKKVTLRAVVATEAGGAEWKEETVECESALALAILYGREEAVKLLLDEGANVGSPIEWKLSAYSPWPDWEPELWENERWQWAFHYPSVMCFALGKVGTVTCRGYTSDCSRRDGAW